MRDKKIWAIAIIAAVIIVGCVAYYNRSGWTGQPYNQTGSWNSTPTPTPSQAPAGQPESFSTKSLSYEQAVTAYVGRRIQFTQTCAASPAQATFKNPTEIMLDNRSDQVRALTVDGTKYTLTAWHFAIINLTTKAPLPHKVIINCDKQNNVAQLTLQK